MILNSNIGNDIEQVIKSNIGNDIEKIDKRYYCTLHCTITALQYLLSSFLYFTCLLLCTNVPEQIPCENLLGNKPDTDSDSDIKKVILHML